MRLNNIRAVRRLLLVVSVFTVILGVGRIIYGFYIIQATGTLRVNTGEPSAVIVIGQSDHNPAILSRGSATVRLKPGAYVVSATLSGNRTMKSVSIVKNQSIAVRLNPAHTKDLPAQPASNFVNFDVLTSRGLSADQLSYMQGLFYKFSPDAQLIALDTDSVQVAPHDPQRADPFVITFSGTIDKTSYAARIEYTDLDNVQLTLTDLAGNQLFSGYAPSSKDS